jgi:hypothetical protein
MVRPSADGDPREMPTLQEVGKKLSSAASFSIKKVGVTMSSITSSSPPAPVEAPPEKKKERLSLDVESSAIKVFATPLCHHTYSMRFREYLRRESSM